MYCKRLVAKSQFLRQHVDQHLLIFSLIGHIFCGITPVWRPNHTHLAVLKTPKQKREPVLLNARPNNRAHLDFLTWVFLNCSQAKIVTYIYI